MASNLLKEMCEDLEKKQGPKKKQAPEDDSDKESDQENPAECTGAENGEEEREEQEHESKLIVLSTSVDGYVRERSGAGDGREGEGGGDGRDSGGGGDGGFPGRLRLPIPPGFPNSARLPNPLLPLNIPWLPVHQGVQAVAAKVYEFSLEVCKVNLNGYSTGENVGARDRPELAHVLSEIIGMYNYDSRV